MKDIFYFICDEIMKTIHKDEDIILSFSGEKSQYIRFNNAKVRQTGCVDDASLFINFIKNNRSSKYSFSFQGHHEIDLKNILNLIENMRIEI